MQTCKPCPPNFLQPLRGQTSCVACPAAGVDCTVQDRLQLHPGWYRPTAPLPFTSDEDGDGDSDGDSSDGDSSDGDSSDGDNHALVLAARSVRAAWVAPT